MALWLKLKFPNLKQSFIFFMQELAFNYSVFSLKSLSWFDEGRKTSDVLWTWKGTSPAGFLNEVSLVSCLVKWGGLHCEVCWLVYPLSAAHPAPVFDVRHESQETCHSPKCREHLGDPQTQTLWERTSRIPGSPFLTLYNDTLSPAGIPVRYRFWDFIFFMPCLNWNIAECGLPQKESGKFG